MTEAIAPSPQDREEVEPVEVLVQLAEDGEIDPWDIDIVQVTDMFLAVLDDSDLRTSGRTLFYASVLLRMKSDELLEPAVPTEPDPFEAWGDPFDAPSEPGRDPIPSLEAEMQRRLERKRQRGSPETLDQLVRELRDAERDSWWKESRTYDTQNSPRGFQRGTQTLDYRADDSFRVDDEPTEQDVTGTTHHEDIERVIEQVSASLNTQYDAGRAEVLYREIRESGGSPVMTYLALLFLSHRGQVVLEQDEIFGDLWIADTDLLPDGADGEAIAD